MPVELEQKIRSLLDQFVEVVAKKVELAKLRRAVVRSMLPCSLVNVVDSRHLFVAAFRHSGMPSTIALDHRANVVSIQDVYDAAKWEFGFDDPFVLQFPVQLLESDNNTRKSEIEAIADSFIASEVQRVNRKMNIIQINPIFGPASYAIDPRLVFVLMPFSDELTGIYNALIKPTIQEERYGLVCRRADDIKSNKAIIQDIWKSICEARLVIADLTGLNPNVMYELGIAHTLGKETVLIYQRGGDVKFPFDLSHIRRVEYTNDAMGGKKLVEDLRGTLDTILSPKIVAD